jgi:hypothetical protein
MRVSTKKNVNWNLKRRIFKLKKRIRRWWNRYVRRQKIRSYISDNESDVVKAISLKGVYSITIDSFGYYNGDYVYAYKLIAMKYGLDMSISNTCVACLYVITLKKRQ